MNYILRIFWSSGRENRRIWFCWPVTGQSRVRLAPRRSRIQPPTTALRAALPRSDTFLQYSEILGYSKGPKQTTVRTHCTGSHSWGNCFTGMRYVRRVQAFQTAWFNRRIYAWGPSNKGCYLGNWKKEICPIWVTRYEWGNGVLIFLQIYLLTFLMTMSEITF